MSDEIKPALTAEEWDRGYTWIQCFESWDDEAAKVSGVGEIRGNMRSGKLLVTSHEHSLHADFSAPADRHALAALCLYGQPFGFSQEDVRQLRSGGPELYGGLQGSSVESEWWAFLESLASRIAALLPPENQK